MENHRNVMVESMKEYFAKIEHKIVKRYQLKDTRVRRVEEAELVQEVQEK